MSWVKKYDRTERTVRFELDGELVGQGVGYRGNYPFAVSHAAVRYVDGEFKALILRGKRFKKDGTPGVQTGERVYRDRTDAERDGLALLIEPETEQFCACSRHLLHDDCAKACARTGCEQMAAAA